jgi:phosphomannomutase
MSEAPLILGVSGLRGIVGTSLTPEVAVRFAGAFGTWLYEREGMSPLVLICRDGRMGGGAFLDAVSAGLRGGGCFVLDCGIQTTPSAGVLAAANDCSGAIIVTASHNPLEWNGLKCLIGDTEGFHAPNAEHADEIIQRFKTGRFRWAPTVDIETRSELAVEMQDLHAEQVSNLVAPSGFIEGMGRRSFAVMDSVNASGAVASARLLTRLGVRAVQLYGDGTGIFPHTPEPTKENLSGEGGLCDAVPGLKADIGFAQDPDADRLAIVDEKGGYIGEEYTIVLAAVALMEGRMDDGLEARPTEEHGKPVFVVNLSTSRMIDDVAAHYGGEVVRTPVGEANVVERMKALKRAGRDVVMGGEGNGGLIWPEVTYVRDSLSAMALTLALMARTGKKVSELVAMIDAMGPGKQGYCILKRKAPLASKADAEPVVARLAAHYRTQPDARVDTQDGVRIDWPNQGVWAHVRASNTEPIMRVIVEAPTEALATQTAQAVEALIARA